MKSLIQILLIISIGIAAIFIAYFVIIDQQYTEPDIVKEPVKEPIDLDSVKEKITDNKYEIAKQKYDNFLNAYYNLVETQRNVIPYPINYGYVTGEGWTDKNQGIAWCINIAYHTSDIDLLLTDLIYTLVELEVIENKTAQMVELVDEKYTVLSELMTEEVNNLEYRSYQMDCDDDVLEHGFDGAIQNFDDCAKAGYDVMESYPEQCRSGDGRVFERIIK